MESVMNCVQLRIKLSGSCGATCMLGPLNGKLHILGQLVICFIRFYR